MARIVHLAMNAEDIDKASDFLNKVFGFHQLTVPGLRSTVRYLTDGNVHIAINQLRSKNDEQGKASPRIDHFGIQVEDVDRCTAEAAKYDCPVVSEPGKVLKLRDPSGVTLEVIAPGTKPGID
jgi:catechol-2,3-dioxygenase